MGGSRSRPRTLMLGPPACTKIFASSLWKRSKTLGRVMIRFCRRHQGLPRDVRFTPECVAKLFAALRARNNRIRVGGTTNQHCAFSSAVESIFRQQPLKIVLQHIPSESGHSAV